MQQFKRYVEVITPVKTFKSSDLHIEFDVVFDDDPDQKESSVRVFNLSQNTINSLKRNQTITLNAGYEGDVGVLLTGRISYVTTRKEGADKVTTINVIDGPDLSRVKVKKKTFRKGIRASTIVRDLVPLLGLPVAIIKLPKDKVYKRAVNISGEIAGTIKRLVKECGASMYINRGKLYIRPLTDGDDAKFALSADTGLIDSPEYFQDEDSKGYNVRCLLQHRITTGSVIQITSMFVKGRYRVRRGSHSCSGNEFITDMEVIG